MINGPTKDSIDFRCDPVEVKYYIYKIFTKVAVRVCCIQYPQVGNPDAETFLVFLHEPGRAYRLGNLTHGQVGIKWPEKIYRIEITHKWVLIGVYASTYFWDDYTV